MHVNFIIMKLTKIGCSQSQPFVYYVTPPLAIMEFLNFDDSTALVTLILMINMIWPIFDYKNYEPYLTKEKFMTHVYAQMIFTCKGGLLSVIMGEWVHVLLVQMVEGLVWVRMYDREIVNKDAPPCDCVYCSVERGLHRFIIKRLWFEDLQVSFHLLRTFMVSLRFCFFKKSFCYLTPRKEKSDY